MTGRCGWLGWVTAFALLALAAGCSSSSTASGGSTTVLTPGLPAFCAVAKQVNGSHKPSYFGSAQNLADVTRLESVAPAAVRPQIAMYRTYLAGGGIDPSQPSSANIDNYPANVRAAVNASSAYITANC